MQIWKRDINIKNINKNMENTMSAYLGISITKIDENSVEGEMIVQNYLKQPYGILHGGASVVLAETLGSLASNLCIEKDYNTVGLDINAYHIILHLIFFLVATTHHHIYIIHIIHSTLAILF